jgi:hypothetical protein
MDNTWEQRKLDSTLCEMLDSKLFLLHRTCWLKKDDKNLARFYTKLSPRVIFRILGHSVLK